MSSKKEFLTELVKDNDLNLEEDIFRMPLGGKQVAIITRTGIEKIQSVSYTHLTLPTKA